MQRSRVVQGIALFTFALFAVTGVLAISETQPASAAVSSTLNFQSRLETAGGAIVPDGNYNVEFKLYSTSTVTGTPDQGACTYNGGTTDPNCLWFETRTGANQVRVVNGYLTVNLGSVTSFPTTINWNQQLYLTMRIGGTGTPSWDTEMSPRIQLTAVPYAFQAGALGNGSNQAVLDASGNLVFQQTSTVKELSAATGTALTIQGGAATSGTNVGGNLLLQGGAGASTGASGSVIVKSNTNNSTTAFQVQNSSGVSVLNVDTTSQMATVRAGTDTSASTTLYNSNNYTTGWTTTGWTATSTSATHNTGNTTALVNTSVAITAGATYIVDWGTSGTCGGSSDTITATIGGTTLVTQHGTTCGVSNSYIATAATTAGLTFTPTANWSGTLNWITIYQVTSTINPAFVVQNASGAASLEVRASTGASSTYIGLNSGAYDEGSTDNTALGVQALQYNTWGDLNVAVGMQALRYNTEGFQNVAIGESAIYSNTTGHDNVGIGNNVMTGNLSGYGNIALGSDVFDSNTSGNQNIALGGLGSNTTGSGNIGLGTQAFSSNTTGSDNTGLGFDAGYQDLNGGFKTLAALQNATAIGAYAQVQASNSIVLGSVDNPTLVGIGITVPSNTLSVSPLDYQAGTATRTNGSATLAGTGTTWTSNMLGDIIIFADGTTNKVTAFTDATHITMGTTYTGTTDAAPVNYRFHHVGLQVTSGGYVGIGTTGPDDPLNIQTSTNNTGFHINGSSQQVWLLTNATSGLLNGMTVAGDQGLYYAGGSVGTANGFVIAPWLSGTAGIRLDGNGKVGVGVSSPARTLDVQGGALTVATQSSYAFGVGNALQGDFTIGSDSSNIYLQTWGSKPLEINNQGNNIYLVPNSGNVGIRTTSTSYPLDVNGVIRSSAGVIATGDDNSGSGGQLRMIGGSYGFFWRNDGSNLYLLQTAGGDQYGAWNSNRQLIAPVNSDNIYFSNNGGSVGIATTSVGHTLTVTKNISGGKVVGFDNLTTTNSTTTGILELRGGWANTSNASRYIQFYSGATSDTNGTGEGSVDAVSGGVTYNTTTADFGEYFTLLNPMDYGDIAVGSTVDGSYGVTKGTTENANIVGVLSNTAGFVGNAKYASDGTKVTTDRDVVGLVGQIKTHVSDINGAIHVGDPITVSAIPGYGAKALYAGQIVGHAMEDFDPAAGASTMACPVGTASSVECGAITVLVQSSWYDPSTGMSSNLQGNNFADLNVSGDLSTYRLVVTSDATFKANIIVDGHVITGGDAPVVTAEIASGTDLQGHVDGACTISGNDTSGTLTLVAGFNNLASGAQCTITFAKPFDSAPRPVVSAIDKLAANVGVYAQTSATQMTLYFSQTPQAGQQYNFNYWNPQ